MFHGKVPWQAMALPLWIATERRCLRNDVSRRSPETEARRPSSLTKSLACLPHAPRVSNAKGTTMCVEAMLAYLVSLLASAFSAADSAFRDEAWRWEGASVSGEVASLATHRSRDRGIIETPSGCFTSDLLMPGGSLIDGTCARCMALHTTSLSRLCRG